MSIYIKYFASLRERIGRASDEIEASEALSVAHVWAEATGEEIFPEDVLIALNQEYANLNALVCDGDEVAFFPPVTGG